MKKANVLIVLVFLIMVSVNGFAQQTKLFSEDFYSVSFDGEGDAIVRAKMEMENLSKTALYQLKLELPEKSTVFKIVQESVSEPLEFETEFGSEQTLITVQLEEPLEFNEKTSIILLYKSAELAEEDFLSNFHFDFKTIVNRNTVLVERVRVAVNTQPNFFLKGAESKVDYKQDFFSESMVMKASSMGGREFTQRYGNIENAEGKMVRETFNLDALESFHVHGIYSKNPWGLFANELLALAAVTLTIGIILLFLYKKQRVKSQPSKKFL